MQSIINALFNTIFVSIPEEAFIVIMTLVFLKRFDMLDVRMWKHCLKWIMVATLPVAIMINVFRYIIIIPRPMMSVITFILMIILIVFILIKNSYNFTKKIIFKTIIFTILSFIIVGLIELLYYPLLLSLLHKPLVFFNNNILYNLLLAIPTRILQLCIVVFILIKKNNKIQVNLFDTIVKNKFFTNSFLIIICSIVLVIIYVAKLVNSDNILINLKIIDQLIIIMAVTSVPIILITWFLMFINYLLIKEKQIQQTYENLIIQDDIMFDVEDDNERR
jgi:hypothetical protein